MLEQGLELERDLFFLLNGSDYAFLDNFFFIYSYKWTWIPFYLCFLFIFIYKKNWKEILLVLLSLCLLIALCDQISSGFFKPYFERFRPTHHPDFKDQVSTVFGYRGGRYGFISSHAANAFGFSTFTALLFRNRIFTITIMIFALVNAYSRIYLGVHFISDVVVGSLVGIFIGIVVYELFIIIRRWIFNLPNRKLRTAVYSPNESYFLSGAYFFFVICMLVVNSQIINILVAGK